MARMDTLEGPPLCIRPRGKNARLDVAWVQASNPSAPGPPSASALCSDGEGVANPVRPRGVGRSVRLPLEDNTEEECRQTGRQLGPLVQRSCRLHGQAPPRTPRLPRPALLRHMPSATRMPWAALARRHAGSCSPGRAKARAAACLPLPTSEQRPAIPIRQAPSALHPSAPSGARAPLVPLAAHLRPPCLVPPSRERAREGIADWSRDEQRGDEE
uniref:Uncharacterized protein n=1 Tax=Setaria viridis TaxID=4556 RepID=A0A4U6VDW7_SETVI|nr:hypothetical protein SEVIR_3G162700v2 [Setaria viridis]